MHPYFRKTALAAAIAIALPAFAQTSEAIVDQGVVVVTATRFSDLNPQVPANIAVITRADIDAAPAMNLPDLLKTRAGINVRDLYGPMGTDAVVDLRGFGDSATGNTLVLLDGQRLNPLDATSINWSAIPMASVERIEIIRGSGTVLFGDRASGGVINIITDRRKGAAAQIAASFGSHGYRDGDAYTAGDCGLLSCNLTIHYAATDGWRRNSQADEVSLAGRVDRHVGDDDSFVDFAAYRDTSGTPGAVFSNQFQQRPAMARYPYDDQKRDGLRLRPGFARALSSEVDVEGELAYAADHSHAKGYSAGDAGTLNSKRDRDGETWSATPRLRWRHGMGTLPSTTVLGVDIYHGALDNPSWNSYAGDNVQRAVQLSQAAYLQNVTALGSRIDMTVGSRWQRMRQEARDEAAALSDSATRTRNAWEFGLTARLRDDVRAYGRINRTFRFPNTDELFGYDPISYATIFRGDLAPQRGTTREVGGSWQGKESSLRVSLYRQSLIDEIAYDGIAYTNVNLPPTRHQGAELEADWHPGDAWLTRFAYTWTDAKFEDGANAGKDIPMVPRKTATLELAWRGGRAGTWSAVAGYVGRQRYSGDEANAQMPLAPYATLDLRAEWDFKPWTLGARVVNLGDRKYASYAGYSPVYADYYYYPAEPRSLFVTAKYSIR